LDVELRGPAWLDKRDADHSDTVAKVVPSGASREKTGAAFPCRSAPQRSRKPRV